MGLFQRGRRSVPRSQGERIQEFWSWWSAEGAMAVRNAFDRNDQRGIVRLLDGRVKALHPDRLAWELEPGQTARLMLVVTAEGAQNMVETAAEWLAEAPAPDQHWEFRDLRQPRVGQIIEIDGVDFDPADVQLAWSTAPDSGVLDVVVHHPAFVGVNTETRDSAMFLLLDLHLGEGVVENQLGELRSTDEALGGGCSLDDLAKVIQERTIG